MKDKLLVIELDEYGSVPRVFYKGEEINKKVEVTFDWKTRDDKNLNLPNITIKYVDEEDGLPTEKTISLQDPLNSCPDCCGDIETTTIYKDGEVYLEIPECVKCGKKI